MYILLINPPWIVRSRKNIWRDVASIMPPLGIAWIAAVLERNGHKVKILDAHAQQLFIENIPQYIRENGPFDLVGITATTPLILNALKIARLIKADFPNYKIVLGGVHPTVLPNETLAEKTVDIVVRGEGEETFCEIAAEKPINDIDGISFRNGEDVVHNPDRDLIQCLDSLPFPAYHLLPMDKYRPAAGAAKRQPATSVLGTRGCFGRCTFCYRIFGHRLRFRSGRNVAEEVKLLQDRYGIKEICFYDDTFTANRQEIKTFCESVQQLKLDLTWSCFSRIDTFDNETFRMMKEAGCHQVMYGVETNNPEILKNMNKRIDPYKVEGVIRSTQKLGLEVRATFMLGSPGETEKTMEETIQYAIRLDPDLALFNITTPFPGTEMFKWADENNYLCTKNWEYYDLSEPIMKLPTVSPEKVKEYYRISHRRFFLRLRFIWNRLKKLNSVEHLVSNFRGLRTLIET